jgi:Flp pilus assembly protein TadG
MQIRRLNNPSDPRRGAIALLSAILLIVLIGFVALTVDVGQIQLTRTQLQVAADAAALAGAMELSGTDSPAVVRANARAAALEIAALHRSGDRSSVTIDPINDITFGKITWNSQTQAYEYLWGENQTPYNVLKVRAMRTSSGGDNGLPLFFAPVLGSKFADVGAEAVATFHPRDIMLVLDFSSSMNDDSSLRAINTLGQTYIESNLLTMWQELGSPVYGNLTFTPQYATLKGVAASGTIPHIDVTFKRTSVSVVSTSNLTQVKLLFSTNATQTFTVSGTKTGTYAGTGTNAGKAIVTAWVKSGTNGSMSSGSNGEQFDFTTTNIKTALGLNGTYPYAAGSWSEYITAVQNSSGTIANAGYRDKYGYLTWLDYLQESREAATETADLWKTSE